MVGCLGRYNPAKRHANLVAAAGVLACRFPNTCFLSVGRGFDAGNPELMQLIEAMGFPERFVLLRERAAPAVCFDAMAMFVLSSRTKAFPNMLAEPIAMGVPCVSTNLGDVSLLKAVNGGELNILLNQRAFTRVCSSI